MKGPVDLFLLFSVFAQTFDALPPLSSFQSVPNAALPHCHLTLPQPDPSLSSPLLSLVFYNRFSSVIPRDARHPESLIKLLPNVKQQPGGREDAAVLLRSV